MGKLLSALFRSLQGPSAARIGDVAKGMGLSARSATLKDVMQYAQQNPFATAMVVYDVFGVASELWQEMSSTDPDVTKSIELLRRENDPVDNINDLNHIARYHDEFAIIREASAIVGSLNRLLKLREAMQMPDEIFNLYLNVKTLKV